MKDTSYTLGPDELRRVGRIQELSDQGPEGLPALVDMLGDPSWAVRRQVVAALGAAGTAAVSALAKVLRERRDDETRLAAAVDALVASVGDADRVAIDLARNGKPAVAADGAQILGRRRSRSGIQVLRELVIQPDDNVAVAAIEALGRIGGRAALEVLVEAASSENFFRVFPTIDVLGRSRDPRAVKPLAALLDKPMYAPEAAMALGRTGERAAVDPLMVLAAGGSDSLVRRSAVALTELLDRYREQFGEVGAVVDSIRQHPSAPAAVRRMTRAREGSDVQERVAFARVAGAVAIADAVALLSTLLDDHPQVSAAAAQGLRIAAQDGDRELLSALRTADSRRRLSLLPLIRGSAAADEVAEALDDPDPDVRVAAAEALGRLGSAGVVPRLFDALDDSDVRVVQAVTGAIQTLGTFRTEEMALQAARFGKGRRRRAALSILRYFGFPSALEVFLEALKSRDSRVRDAALQGLAVLEDPRARAAVLATVRSEDPRARASAVRALGQIPSDLRVEGVLLSSLEDDDPWVRYYAAQALGRLRVEAAVARLVMLLGDPAGQVRVAAVEALSHLRSDAAQQALLEAADAEDPDVQRAGLIGLGIARRPRSLPVLVQAAAAPDPATRLVAVSALSGFQGPEVLDALSRAARDENTQVAGAAVGFLSSRAGEEASDMLVRLLQDDTLRERALEALAVPAPGRVAALAAALGEADEELAPMLVTALTRMRRPAASAVLMDALGYPNSAARKAAASAVAALQTPEAFEALRRLVADDADPEVRRVAALLLAG